MNLSQLCLTLSLCQTRLSIDLVLKLTYLEQASFG